MISRSQMNRQLYMGGGITQLPVNEMMVPRGQYGLGSIVKSITKPIKKAVSAVGDFAKSDIGKLAILAAGGYYLGGGALMGGPGFTFGQLGTSLASPFKAVGKGLFGAAPVGDFAAGTKGLFGSYGFQDFLAKTGASQLGISSLIPGKGTAIAAIGGGLLGSLFGGSKEKAQEAFARDPQGVKNYLVQYYKNINKKATDEEATQFAEEQTREYAANGGRIGFDEGGTYNEFKEFMRELQQGEDEERKQRLMEMFKQYQRRKKPVEAANGGRIGLAMGDIPMGELRENQGGIMELDYRDTGGFVPVGIKEKADDVPAMLSKNEFVFTADAVRNAGNGDVEKGAQRLYNTMKTLENGGTV